MPHVRTLRDSVPAAIEVVLTRALAKIPADRFPSTGEFARALESAGRTEQDSVVTIPSQQGHARRGPLLRRAAIRAAAVLFVIALLIAGAFLLRDRTGSAREPPTDLGSTSVLAVLPFTVRGSPAIEYLGEGARRAAQCQPRRGLGHPERQRARPPRLRRRWTVGHQPGARPRSGQALSGGAVRGWGRAGSARQASAQCLAIRPHAGGRRWLKRRWTESRAMCSPWSICWPRAWRRIDPLKVERASRGRRR